MAGHFLMQKLSSQMARSRSLFATHASATASARGGSIRTTTNLSNGAAHIGIAVPNNAGIHTCDDGIRALSFQEGSIRTRNSVSHGTAARPGTAFNNSIGIHACQRFVDSVGGAKRALSSDVCTRNRTFKKPQWAVEWDARSAAWQAECAAWEAEMDARTADFNKFMRRQKWLWGFTCFCWISGSFLEEYGTRCTNGKSTSHGTSSCGSPKS